MNETRGIYAHSVEGIYPHEGWQKLDEHLRGVADKAAMFAAVFDSSKWARAAGWLHDLGKAHPAFQAYLMRENGLDDAGYDEGGHGRINHSIAGAALAEEMLGPHTGRVLAYLAAGHHAGLPDWHSSDTGNAALEVRLREGRENLAHIREYAQSIIPNFSELKHPPEKVKPANIHLWIRMLFSCLVDADFLDTEKYLNPGQHQNRSKFKPLGDLKEAFDCFMSEMTGQSPKTPVNGIRREVLRACRAAAGESPGIFSLTVPTGGGKTLSGMAFALEHAVRHGKARIIYVIPYTSIIEQTAQVLSGIFGAENVVEHHCNLDPERETPRSRLASENWDAPVIVTTNVQFFESLYASRSGACRKLHNMADSVVILDEAQLLPPRLLQPCVDAMNQLTRNYGMTLLFSTATQPALPGLDAPREIIPEPGALYAALKRTEIIFPEDIQERRTWESLAEELRGHRQVLCIVNTRRDCHDLFQLMPEGTLHLSALMCGAHRSRIIADIKLRLKNGDPVRVVSTQLVEAGVDIDFPVVYRALAGLDSIAQAAGRCNREGKMNAEGCHGKVHVFVPPKPAPRGLLRKGEDTARELLSLPGFDPDSPDEYARYFRLFYGKVNDTGGGFHDWLVRDVNPDLAIHFRTAAENFRMIDDQIQCAVFVRHGESEGYLRQLRAVGPKREIMRGLQRYAVNLPRSMTARMLDGGLLEELWPGFFAQAMPGLYDPVIGLNVYRENIPVEDLMV